MGFPTPPQVMGWPVIGAGKSCLVLAPTGSGKTLAAFLAAIDWLARRLMAAEAESKTTWGVQILYVSPLKSLANDVQKNLIKPLRELSDVAAGMGVKNWPEINVAVRTGDTPQKERAAISKRPPHILITTPESLNLMITSGGRAGLSTARFLIVDEVHALAGNKRGVFLSLVLERMEEERRLMAEGKGARGLKIAPGVYVPVEPLQPLVRIGLSATARPEEVIGAWLAGLDDAENPRPIEIVRSGQRKRLDLGVVCPFGGDEEERFSHEERKEKGVGHWPEVTRAVLQMIREHRSTLVFANSRRLIERMAGRFQDELAKETEYQQTHPEQAVPKIPLILPHHGSISKEVRLETEQALKRGEVDAVLATSSLELGIDVGALDLVIQVDSPGNVAGALQRVGRAGHLERATAKGRLLARGLGELPSLGALVPLMYAGVVEETRVPENCLDVLAQQIVAACAVRPWKRGELYRVIRRAMPYRTLTEKQFDSVVAMLSRRAERVTAQGLRPRLSFDRVNDELIIMPGTAKVLMLNSGVIADTGQFPVYLIGGKRGKVATSERSPTPPEAAGVDEKGVGVRLGELDEEFVYETKEGERIILGSQTWKVVRIDADRVLVEPAAPGSSRMPFWRGEQAPRSELLADAIAIFHGEMERRLKETGDDPTREWLMTEHRFDDQSAENVIGYYRRQMAAGMTPSSTRIVVEHFLDRTGEPIIAILSPLGSRANYAMRLAIEGQFAKRRLPAQIIHHDDGLLIRPPVEVGEIPENPLAWLRAGTVEQEITDQLETSALFGLRFRQNAARALMLPRMMVTQRTPLWQQRLRARHLLALVKKQRNFPIIVETYREVLQDVLGIERTKTLLRDIERGVVTVATSRGAGPSPFARTLYSQFQATYLYDSDEPLTHVESEPTIDQSVLDEILQRRSQGEGKRGAEEAPAWSAADEAALHRRILGLDYPARSAEEFLEKIEAAGAVGVEFLTADDPRWQSWVAGGAEDVRRMLEELSSRRRLVLAECGTGKKRSNLRWVAVENLGLLVAARGDRPCLWRMVGHSQKAVDWAEIPPALLETTLSRDEAQRVVVEQVVRQTPVTTVEAVVKELPWMGPAADAIVAQLMREGVLQSAGNGRIAWLEYVEQLRSFALRRQRKAAATADVAALQRHLLRWQHLETPHLGTDAVEDVLDMLTGFAAPLSVWENEILPARVRDFTPAILDAICRSGHRVWVGGGGGAIAFWPRHLIGERAAPAETPELSATAQRVLELLQKQGASFLLDLEIGLTLSDGELALALEELVFAGRVSNDQLESLHEIDRLAVNARRVQKESDGRREAWKARYAGRLLGERGPKRMANGWWKSRDTSGAGLGGRWFVLPAARGTSGALGAIDLAERAADRVERLMRRNGFACRELIEPEVDGSWRDCYDVLTRMEWAGTVRRGYFVEGITGSQFALPGVHLETGTAAGTLSEVHWISMVDPANVWARVSTRWLSDSGEAARVPRTAGSWIALVDGRPVLAAVSWGQRLIPLPAPWEQQEMAIQAVSALFPRLPRLERPHLEVRHWDQQEIVGSPAEDLLRKQGFSRDTQGLRLYRQYLPQSGSAPAR
ncbi:MAG TPA: DEAD/DEAH box helicase [Phycisphaerae bacterium]|nr:DEAD/DEAH box helicase [Phycisphaerae bacterium]